MSMQGGPMARKRNITIWAAITLGMLLAAIMAVKLSHRHKVVPLVFTGAVVIQSTDARKESPIADVEISATNGSVKATAKSDFSGLFKIVWPAEVDPAQPIILQFRHPDYKPIDVPSTDVEKLYVIRLIPVHGQVEADLNEAEVSVTNVLVRYSTETMSTENIGTGVKTFQVVNTGNIPCNKQFPCSPDGKWKAATDSASLDAGDGNVFQNARVTCIAGPCPFIKVQSEGFSKPARNIKVAVLDWSDTTTILLQAEVFHNQFVDTVRTSYPVIFGRSMNFTVPGNARGTVIEADLNKTQIVFVLAPDPELTWAHCKVRVESNQVKDYRCELKPGYQFQ
jgi:hypothetical protein